MKATPAAALIMIMCMATVRSSTVQATEIDDYSTKYKAVKDSTAVYNRLMNAAIDRSIHKTNEANSRRCLEEAFYSDFANRNGGMVLKAKIESWADLHTEIESLRTPYRRSVFAGSGVAGWEGGIYGHLMSKYGFSTATVKINGIKIGVDKLGHFFQNGYEYFQISRVFPTLQAPIGGIESALQWGAFQEATIWGIHATGIYSYADLAANLDGLSFWNKLFGGADPILACHENRIVRIREFRFEDYVTEAWNESLNASWYSSKEAAKKIEENVAVLAAQHDDFRADPDTNLCHKLVEHYGVYAAHVLNPVCIRAGSPSAICGERLLQ